MIPERTATLKICQKRPKTLIRRVFSREAACFKLGRCDENS